jgi:lambda repressor-like predicted transcriptional regulator
MKSQILGAAGAALASLVFAATVVAAGPTPSPSATTTQARDTVPSVLDLTQAQVQALRHDGLSLAQIAERQKVDPQRLVDALAAQWTSRIEVRVANGALTTDEATTLKADVQTRAKSMVNQVTLGGMQGAAVGAGPRNGAGRGAGMGNGTGARGMGTGTGTCDGTGPNGAGQP